jgi:hypothetical protein
MIVLRLKEFPTGMSHVSHGNHTKDKSEEKLYLDFLAIKKVVYGSQIKS